MPRVDFVEAWFKACRFTIASGRQSAEATAAGAAVARHLSLYRGAPVLKATELYIAADGRPVGFFISHYHPAHICIASQHRWAAHHARVRNVAK